MKCVLCGDKISGHGHNAEPLKKGNCCSDCNYGKVIPERLKRQNNEDDGCSFC